MKRRINEHSSLRNPQCCCQDNDDDNNNFDDDDDLLLGFEREMAKDYEMDGEAQTEKSERYIAATIITIIAIIITITITIIIMPACFLPNEPRTLLHHPVVILNCLQLTHEEVPGQHRVRSVGHKMT